MTDKEIIKALECCKKDDCKKCPNNFGNCYANLAGYALDLINRRERQIDRLMEECGKQSVLWSRHFENIFESAMKTAKSEAIKEFAERLKEKGAYNSFNELIIFEDMVDNLVKEMTGETKTEKCNCFCEEQRIKGWLDSNTPITEPITVCNGTRERDECTCGGDKSKCDFYAKDYSYGY